MTLVLRSALALLTSAAAVSGTAGAQRADVPGRTFAEVRAERLKDAD